MHIQHPPRRVSSASLPYHFRQVSDLSVTPDEAPIVVLCGALSLMCGGSVGPEAALGWAGGAAGSYLAERVTSLRQCKHAVALDGMAAALGALFPTPVLGVVILLELGDPDPDPDPVPDPSPAPRPWPYP